MSIISVKFRENSKVYNSDEHYYCVDFRVSPGDEVLVSTDSGIKKAMVYSTNVLVDYNNVEGTVLYKIDTEYLASIEKYMRLESLKKRLEERAKEITDFELYERLAEDHKDIADLLIEYKNLIDETP